MLKFQQNGENMKKYFEVLKNCPLFADIGSDELSSLLSCLSPKAASFKKGETVMCEGSAPEYIAVVLSGRVSIIRSDYLGNRSILGIAESGEMFAESFACAQADRLPIDVVASEDCEVLLIECRKILRPCVSACGFHNQMIYNLMKNTALKNIMFHQKIEVTSKRSTREKLLTYLSLCSKRLGSRKFKIPFDRQGLADYLEVERSGLSAEIGKLRAEGILKSRKNEFELL